MPTCYICLLVITVIGSLRLTFDIEKIVCMNDTDFNLQMKLL